MNVHLLNVHDDDATWVPKLRSMRIRATFYFGPCRAARGKTDHKEDIITYNAKTTDTL